MHHQAQINLITQQLRTGQVLDEQILNTYSHIPRSLFVPEQYVPFAYSDMQIPLEHDQTMLTPLEEGLILQNMNLKGHETLLEIGTGTGYFTALLSRFVTKIFSVDCFQDFIQNAEKKIRPFKHADVKFICQYAENGLPKYAPYDAIIISAAVPKLPEALKMQLAPGGKIFYISGSKPAMQGKIAVLDKNNCWKETVIFDTCVPSMLTEQPNSTFVF
jgi:protein-L-isoaspartate(D-aspartate) O-methyltransferase